MDSVDEIKKDIKEIKCVLEEIKIELAVQKVKFSFVSCFLGLLGGLIPVAIIWVTK